MWMTESAKKEAESLAHGTGLDAESLNDAIADLMVKYGPDGHCDGSEVIAHFVRKLLERELGPTV